MLRTSTPTMLLLALIQLVAFKFASAAPSTEISTRAVVNNPAAKVGLAWPNGNDPSLSHFKTAKVSPLYTWGPYLPPNLQSIGLTGIPMLWGDGGFADFKKLVVKGYATTVLGFNEPNEPGQSNMTPARAATLWKQYIQPLKSQGFNLISPATSGNPNGIDWMKSFMKSCGSTCTFDGVAIHYYDVSSSGMIKWIQLWHNTFGKPIWVTEFACQNYNGGAQCTKDQVFAFMAAVTAYMDKTSWVVHYFAFGVMHDMQGVNKYNQLMGSSGWPTTLGKQYIGKT